MEEVEEMEEPAMQNAMRSRHCTPLFIKKDGIEALNRGLATGETLHSRAPHDGGQVSGSRLESVYLKRRAERVHASRRGDASPLLNAEPLIEPHVFEPHVFALQVFALQVVALQAVGRRRSRRLAASSTTCCSFAVN